jgi:5'-3' exonuclease
MGIKHLNRFIATRCDNTAIRKINLSELSGKKIAIDASIYLYRFISDDRLLEQFYLMLSIFRHYNIIPIFVFDGAAPQEKQELLKERREIKQRAEEKYNELEIQLHAIENDADKDEKQDIAIEMLRLKKDFIRIKDTDIKQVKSLLVHSGASWIHAKGEADVLCAQLIHTGRVYACLSEDMDMFAYGCSRVLRHISLIKHTALLYDLREILHQLGMTMDEFRQVLVLSGTDYNKDDTTNLKDSIALFHKYKENEVPTFYEWLHLNTGYIKDYDRLKLTYDMFDATKNIDIDYMKKISIETGTYSKTEVEQTMEKEGFLFMK